MKLRYIIISLLAGSLLLLTPVALATDGGSTNETTTTTTSSNDDTSKIETENNNMTDRLAQLKTKFKVQLTFTEAANLKLHCVAAQGVISQLNTKFGNSVTTRTQAYTELQTKLNKLVTNLKAKNVDTTTLAQEITILNTKIANYNTDLTAYKQTLTDLKAIDCKTDPTGFKTALLAARAAHDKLVADVIDIRTYLKGTIKVTLESILTTLDSSASTTNTTNGGTQ